MDNHLVDPTEKDENTESSENVETDKWLYAFAPLESKWKRTMENHRVDPIEKAENAKSSENVTKNTTRQTVD